MSTSGSFLGFLTVWYCYNVVRGLVGKTINSHKSELNNNLVLCWFVKDFAHKTSSPRFEAYTVDGPYHTQWCCSTPTESWDPWCSTRDGDDYPGYDSSCPLNLCPYTFERTQRGYGEEGKKGGGGVSHNNWWGLPLLSVSVISVSICLWVCAALSVRKVSMWLSALQLTFWAGSGVCAALSSPISGTPCRSPYGPFCRGNLPRYTSYRLLSTKNTPVIKTFVSPAMNAKHSWWPREGNKQQKY